MGSSLGSIYCFSDEDTKRMSLVQQDGLALEMTCSDGQKRSNFDTRRVVWPEGPETPTFDSSALEVIDKFTSDELEPTNNLQTGRDYNTLRISVDLASASQSPNNLKEQQEPYDKVPTGRYLEALMGNMQFSMGPRMSRGSQEPHEKVPTGRYLEALMGNMQFSMSPRMSSCSQDSTFSETSRPSYLPIPMTKVLSHLWIGTFNDANNETELKLNGITHILSLVGHQSPFEWVKHKHYPMDDHGKTDLKAVIDEVSDFVETGQKGNNRLLVHCQSGQNRSAVVIIATLMIMYKKTLYRAHRELKKIRPIVQVNVLYAKQLLQLEQELFNGVNSLPLNWMELEYNESEGDILYKHENMTTSRHGLLQLDSEEK